MFVFSNYTGSIGHTLPYLDYDLEPNHKYAIATALIGIFCIFLSGTPEGASRNRTEILYLHLGIRLRHLLESWFYLKPLFSSHISGHHLDKEYAPNLGYFTKQGMKLVWIVSGFFKSHGIITQIIYRFTGIEFLLGIFYSIVESCAVATCESLSPGGNNNRCMPIDEYDWKNGSPDDFFEKYLTSPKPVILRGFSHDNEAVKKWKFEYMMKKYGDEDVMLTKAEIDGFPGKLKEVDDPKVYLHNCEVLFNKYPEMKKEMNLERLAPYIKKGLGYSQLFMGRCGTGTPLHCAGTWNWFNMLDGQKTWYFVDPEYTWFIYPFVVMGQVASFCLVFFPDEYNEKTNPMGYHEEAHPLVKWCPYYKATLSPGDVLLNPPWWWHAIKNISPTSVAVASRWHGDGAVGRGFLFTSEDYEINRLFDWNFFVGIYHSIPFLQNILGTPSPVFDEHMTVRERKNRFTHLQRKFAEQKWKF